MTNLELLEQFTRVTGIRDQKAAMAVAGLDADCRSMPRTTSTVTVGVDEGKPMTLDDIAIWFGTIERRPAAIYPWRFDVGQKLWWPTIFPSMWASDVDDIEENRIREFRNRAEKEWTLRDIVPLDGWILREE